MSEPITTATIFRALAHAYRRYALSALAEHGTMTLADLADEVAVRAFEQPLDDIAAQDREQVLSSLLHAHVPRLAAAGLVEYSQSETTVSLGEAAEQAMPFLSLANDGTAKPA